jgi:hypothetical protein
MPPVPPMPPVVDGQELTVPQDPTPNCPAEYVPAAAMMTSPHWTECFGVCHGPQFAPQAVADVPLLLSLPVGDKKYVCSAANVAPVGAELGDVAGEGVGVGLTIELAVGAGVGVDPLLDGVLLPPLHDERRIAQASDAILATRKGTGFESKVKDLPFASVRRRYLAACDRTPSSVMRTSARERVSCVGRFHCRHGRPQNAEALTNLN